MRNAVFCVSLLAAGMAQASDLSVFGLRFDQPLALPECPYTMTGGASAKKLYRLSTDATCAWEPAPHADYATPVRRIVFSRSEAPSMLKAWSAVAYESDDKLAGLQFTTGGLSTQAEVLRQLVEKFGPPSAQSTRTVKTALGATFTASDAEWFLPNLRVSFSGALDDIETGRVRIERPAATADRLKKATDQRKDERRL